MVRSKPLPGKRAAVMKTLETIAELSGCDKGTAETCFIARLHPRSIEHLDFTWRASWTRPRPIRRSSNRHR